MTLTRLCAHIGLDYSGELVELVVQPIDGTPATSYLITPEQWLDLVARGRELPPVRRELRERGDERLAREILSSAGGGREAASHAERSRLWPEGGAA